MHFSDHDLRQLDAERLGALTEEQLRVVSQKLLVDLKAARERLNQNAQNSSRPPSSQGPWERVPEESFEDEAPEVGDAEEAEAPAGEPETPPEEEPAAQKKPARAQGPGAGRPGRRRGAPGVSRTQVLPVDAEVIHAPSCCALCGQTQPLHTQAYTARYEIDLVAPETGLGLVLRQTKHVYQEWHCACGHHTRAAPGRCEPEEGWRVELSEWHLVGAGLVVFLVALAQRQRVSRARIREFLLDWWGLSLSTATINQCLHEAGRAAQPVVDGEIIAELRAVDLAHADETSWLQQGQALWLWVFTSATVVLFLIGRRSRAVVAQALGEAFNGYLMCDGYQAYRHLPWRLRCWAHIVRKARGLAESLDREAQGFGTHVLGTFEALMDAVYAARAAPAQPPGTLRQAHAARLQTLFEQCRAHADSAHAKTRELARELLLDWDTFWGVLEDPARPLTNNEAERALRHYVIARRISLGTRTEQGSRAFALLASVIETCRKRAVSPWPYLAEVIRQRRRGLPAPPLPQPAA